MSEPEQIVPESQPASQEPQQPQVQPMGPTTPDMTAQHRYYLEHHSNDIRQELINARQYVPVKKDIVIVVHDQLEIFKNCVESIERNTKDYNLYIWDNASQAETAEYIQTLGVSGKAFVYRHNENVGFVVPNNRLVASSSSPYVILLNSDTIVRRGWDETMIAWLQTHPDVGAVGCSGGLLGEDMVGIGQGTGYNIDYVCGWCVCFPRSIYERFGLFDEQNMQFAYGEDSDFSLRLKTGGMKVYAMFSDLVLHLSCRTSLQVMNERPNMSETFAHNHTILRERWKNYPRIMGGVKQ